MQSSHICSKNWPKLHHFPLKIVTNRYIYELGPRLRWNFVQPGRFFCFFGFFFYALGPNFFMAAMHSSDRANHSGTIHFLLRRRRYGASFWRSCTIYKIEFYKEMYTSFQQTTTSRPFTYNLHTNLRRTPEFQPKSRALEDPEHADSVNKLWIYDNANWSPVLVENS